MGQEKAQPVLHQETTIRSRLFNVMELTLLFFAALLGVVSAAALALAMTDFQGDCPLFAQVDWTNMVWFRVDAMPSPYVCNYCIMSQLFLSLSAICLIILRCIVTCSNAIHPATRYKIRIFFMVPFLVVANFFVLCQSTLMTAGLNTLCRGLMDGGVDEIRCWMLQPVDWYVYDGSRIYDVLFVAMLASWFTFLIWSGLTTASCLVIMFARKRLSQ